jgi:hypothetical protein
MSKPKLAGPQHAINSKSLDLMAALELNWLIFYNQLGQDRLTLFD